MASARASLALALCAAPSAALMYDVVERAMTAPAECARGCAPWSSLASAFNTAPQAAVDALWASRDAQAAAGSSCAMPANFAGAPGGAPGAAFDFSFGPQCYCAGAPGAPTAASGYCGDPAEPTPQQVNVAFGADAGDLAVAFVTVDGGAPLAGPPVVEVCGPALGAACVNASGATARAAEPQAAARVLSYHNVPLPRLAPGARYTYRVRGGTARGAWRGPFELRPRPAAGAPARFALAGDLGVYPYNCFANLLKEDIVGFVHLGDHACTF